MWVFLNDSFFSIVQHREKNNVVVVRARIKGDLENVFGHEHGVFDTKESDYKFRMFLNKEYVSKVLQEKVMAIDYGNFKDSIKKNDTDRKSAYMYVWSVMNGWQEKLYGKQWW